MWKIGGIKKNARTTLKRSYFSIIIACVLITVILGAFQNPITKLEDALSARFEGIQDTILFDGEMADPQRLDDIPETESEVVNTAREVIEKFMVNNGLDKEHASRWTSGVLSMIVNNSYGAGNLLIGILNTINQTFFDNKIHSAIIIGIGVIVFFFIFVLFMSVALVGFYRYLLEKRRYGAARVSRIFFVWSIKRGLHVAWVMLVKNFYLFLWSLTIIGGIIKSYSYRLVPIILAENPDMSAKEAINLSRDMMNGNKWHAFLLDFSFIGWIILSVVTFGIVGIFYYAPYSYLANVELYAVLKAEAKENSVKNADMLCDKLLDAPYSQTEYPINEYFIPTSPKRKWLNVDFDRNYSATSIILLFFAFAFIGWIWEVSLHLFEDGVFVNRGTSHGPWLPIYGFGGITVLLALRKFRKNLPLTFALSILLSGVIEYITSWFIEYDKGLKYWDYSGYFLNINGRICLEGLIMFALGGCLAIYVAAPLLDNLFKKIPNKYKVIICIVLVSIFLVDQVYSHFVPNIGKGITDYYPKS